MSFAGQGFVVVQRSEESPSGFVGGIGGGNQSGQDGGVLGGLLRGRQFFADVPGGLTEEGRGVRIEALHRYVDPDRILAQ